MLRTVVNGKIHRATVTQADLHYVGSITIDRDLMDRADFVEGEKVLIVDVTNGARLETYVIEGQRASGVIGINGAAAHLIDPGDLVIIMSFVAVSEDERQTHGANVVHVDAQNRIVEQSEDLAAPACGSDEIDGRLT
ncbi:aspartate 1-decarboxylase [Salinisphaera japonica]|uniref:Aspartate 1-decarboxylase n=1 Tax=Salinisphaera japonica YTM-1 TaxID=1209778 RepID=A0A423PNW1_9GAMM|nr:aspartate 1-decarboxylase [Salinisphaera japonica]ROO27306.1 aspartate decarboxylase [Salinisphaera japonica YTM-1]